ncbi:hypothetical protein WR25_20013 [Diploscapter pachys]|uniref:Uncharacterized protein n=1 Tax=Diploscapter pachys TaxID=2018661 RepID=A0A2A2JU33_9BILA|nr:hypothetical protein WR25_20013 [Diploscapter pachys]
MQYGAIALSSLPMLFQASCKLQVALQLNSLIDDGIEQLVELAGKDDALLKELEDQETDYNVVRRRLKDLQTAYKNRAINHRNRSTIRQLVEDFVTRVNATRPPDKQLNKELDKYGFDRNVIRKRLEEMQCKNKICKHFLDSIC